MRKIRIDDIRGLRRHSVRILNQLLNDQQPEFERYKVVNAYFNTISKTFQIEQANKLQVEVSSPEVSDKEMYELIDKMKRMTE